MAKSSTFYYVIALLCLSTFPNASSFGNSYSTVADEKNSEQLSALISQLDSKDFQQRELAEEKLISIGEPAIEPLATKSFRCSPEVRWRIRKILEQISTRGSETVFYKTTGILQLRFGMEKRLSTLQAKWQHGRKEQAIKMLRKNGAVVNDPMEGMNPNPAPAAAELILGGGFGGGRHFLLVDGKFVEQSPTPNNDSLKIPKRAPRKQLTTAEAKKEIKRILESDLAQARKIVLGDEPTDASIAQPQVINMARPLAGGVFGRGANMLGQGVTVELGERWKGNAKGLDALEKVSNLTEVKLSAQNLNDSILAPLAKIESINKLVFEKCELSAKDIRNIRWSKSIREIEFANVTLTSELISSLKSFPSVNLLTFHECELDQDAEFNALKDLQTVRGLEFKSLDIPNDLFVSIGELRQLTYINLANCKFKTSGYKSLKQLRPNLQISYTPQAFLGVRGPSDIGVGIGGCVISEVISGSGAQKGGMKVHDVIEMINGQKVEVFEDIRLHIAQHRPGEKLDVKVNRLGKKVDLVIELSSFDDDAR